MKQKQYSPMNFAEQAVVIFALNNGLLDTIPVIAIGKFEEEVLRYMHSSGAELLKSIIDARDVSGDIKANLETTLKDFLKSFTA